MDKRVSLKWLLCVVAISLAITSTLFAVTATVTTDKKLYSVGATMVVSGQGFTANSLINVSVLRPDHQSDFLPGIISDATGAFSAPYTPPLIPGRYKITATDGGNSASTASTEADSIGYSKAVYNKGSFAPNDTTGVWTTGNAGSNYLENQWAYYQYQITGVPTIASACTGTEAVCGVPSFDVDFNHHQSNTDAIFVDSLANFRVCVDCDLTDPSQVYTGNSPSQGLLLNGIPYPASGDNFWVVPTINGAIRASSDTSAVISVINEPFADKVACPAAAADPLNTPSDFHCFHVSGKALSSEFLSALNTDRPDGQPHSITIFYAAHLAASFVWLQGFEAKLGCIGNISYVSPYPLDMPDPTAYGTNAYNPTAGACSIDGNSWTGVFNGVGAATGSSRQFQIDNQTDGPKGGLTLPIPSVPAPSNHIIITKVTNPASAVGATFSYTGSFGSFNLDTDSGTATPNTTTFNYIATGVAYTVTEGSTAGWNLTNLACAVTSGTDTGGTISTSLATSTASITLGPLDGGVTVTCTYTNTLAPKLTVNKVLVPSTDAGLFNLQIDGATAGTGANVGNGGTTGAIDSSIGAHTAGETQGTGTLLADYTTVIGGDCAANGSVTLAAGDNKVCTITNTRKPKLTVNKVLVPSTDAGLFNLQIDGATAGTGANVGNGGTTGAIDSSIGAHTAGETQGTGTLLADYTTVIGGDCAANGSVTLAAGDNKVCTITNTRKPKLTVNKVLVPSTDAGLFNLQIDGATAGTGANVGNGGTTGAIDSSIGAHTAGETQGTGTLLADYTTVIGGDCAANGSVTLAAGDNKVCTITNTRKPKLTVNKVLVPSTDAGLFNLQIDGATAGTGANVGNGGTTGAIDSSIGAHTAGETQGTGTLLADYTTVIGGDCAANGSVTLAAGDNKVCTITNTRKPKLTVNKVLVPSTDAGLFNLQIDGATAGTGANVGNGGTTGAIDSSIGAHTAGETQGTGTLLADYTTVIGGDCAANGSVTLAAGDNKVCTITNTRKPKLTVNKVLVPSTDAGLFNLQIDGATAGTGANVGNGGTTGAIDSSIGAHTAGETQGTGTLLADYTTVIGGDCAANGSVTLAAGDNKVCTITNTRKPKLTVNKVLVPSTDAGLFNLQIDGATAGTGANVGNGGTTGAIDSSIGAHTAGETQGTGTLLADYTTVIGGDCAANGSVTLAAGDNKVCTITNTRKPKLTVNKVLVPSTDAGLFNLQIDGATAGTGANVGNGGTTGAIDSSIGAHTAGETQGTGTLLADYTTVIGGDCAANGSVTLAAGDNKVCTITNTRKPKLTVNKVLVPSTDAGLFNLQIDGATAGTGANVGNGGTTGAIDSSIGAHTAGETQGTGTLLADYTTVIGGDCAANGSVTLAAGDNKVCTITNTRKPKLTVNKVLVPSTDAGLFNLQIDGATAGTGANVGNGGTTGAITSTIGAHTAGETQGTGTLLADYTTVIGGDCAANGSVTLAAGDNKVCTITNTRKPRLTVNKVTVPANDTGKFNLQIDGATAGTGANVGNGGTTGAITSTIGAHTAGETQGTGTLLADYTTVIGGDCAANGSVTLAAGDNKVCTITNYRKPRLTIIKNSKGGTGTFFYTVSGPTPSSPSILTSGSPNGTGQSGPGYINIGSYNILEQGPPAGWTMTGAGCSLGSSHGDTNPADGIPDSWDFVASWGDNIVCTFENTSALTTRTQGFWATHTDLANNVWNGTSAVLGATPLGGDSMLCGVEITATATTEENWLMGGFWANIANATGKGKDKGKRDEFDKARMQMLQQYLAAVLNVHAFGTAPPESLQVARDAYCGADNAATLAAIKAQIGILGSFNESGDSGVFTPGESATPSISKGQADIDAWDNPAVPGSSDEE